MKFFLLIALVWPTGLGLCQISTGTEPLEARLGRADFVCVCLVTGSTIRRQIGRDSAQPTGYVTAVLRTYKGSTKTSTINISTKTDEFALANRTRYVLMLESSDNSSAFIIVDALAIPQSFPPTTISPKDQSLEDDLNRALAAEGQDDESLLRILDQFQILSGKSQAVLQNLARSKNEQISLLSMSLLVKKSPNAAQLFPQFLGKLRSTPVSRWPEFNDLTLYFVSDATTSDEETLESLAMSQRRDISHASLRALRKLTDPATTGFFMHELDSPDSDTQYLAIISLAEIYKKSGDFAPGMGPFEQNRGKYLQLWKAWYHNGGGLP
jgi:hypothetical protein